MRTQLITDSQIKIAHAWRKAHRRNILKIQKAKAEAEKIEKEKRRLEYERQKREKEKPRKTYNPMGMGSMGARTKSKNRQP